MTVTSHTVTLDTVTATPDAAAWTPPPAPPYGVRGRAARKALRQILRRVPVTARLSDGPARRLPSQRSLETPSRPMIDIVDPESFFARLGQSPMIGLGESYMAAEWQAAPGTDLADALTPFAERLTDLVPAWAYRLRHAVLPRGLNPGNSRHGARRNIERHYDLSNEMFARFLDPSLSYSSALFETLQPAPRQADLETAQLRKVDAVLDAAGVRAGSRVLEIGTGWGTLAIRAAQRGAHVTTITISQEQAALARARVEAAGVADRVEVALRDYRDQAGLFDAVVSVEMIEAVGERYWPTYFAAMDALLAPGGRIALQAILLEDHRYRATRDTYTWIHKYIFPGGLLPSIEAIEVVTARHTTLRVGEVVPMGQHYAHTLRLWREKFLDGWAGVQALGFDATFRRMWEFYLAYCEAGFRAGYIDVAQITLQRVTEPVSGERAAPDAG